MGMISRVRSRLQSLTLAHNKDLKVQDEPPTPKSVCLLSVILVLPYILRFSSPCLVTFVSISYVLLVWPMLVTSWPCNRLLDAFNVLETEMKEWAISCGCFLQHVVLEALIHYKNRMETSFLKMKNLSAMLTQIVFFALADHLLLPNQRLSCFYSLMFYNVLAYCISYVQQLIYKEDWSPYVLVSKTTNVKHLAMSTVKITLEFTKAVTFIITVVFMLLVFGLEQGLEHYKPTWSYIITTGVFYMLTEKTFVDSFPTLLEFFSFELLENLETLWAPVILRFLVGASSALFIIPTILTGKARLALMALYVNGYLVYKELDTTSWSALKKERAMLSRYRYATRQEVRAKDDVCAVCLQPMRYARVTPCNHMFHGDCLRRCLKERFSCPMCKRELN